MNSSKLSLLLIAFVLMTKGIAPKSISNKSLEESIKIIMNDPEFKALSGQKQTSVLIAVYWLLVDKYKYKPISAFIKNLLNNEFRNY